MKWVRYGVLRPRTLSLFEYIILFEKILVDFFKYQCIDYQYIKELKTLKYWL
ncbi:MAG: hypothetical protein ACI8YQ_000398 [Polaribacter sp.]|jgi:hypothetical protein